MTAHDTIIESLEAGVLLVTLNRPYHLNALNQPMHLALHASLDRAAKDASVRAVLLTGAGRGFCAGQDLAERDPKNAATIDLGDTLERLYNPLIRKIRDLEKPVICAVNGVAAGAGANLALACDIVLAARSARFIQSFARIGLVPDSGGSWLLPRLIGEARAMALALTAEPLSAEDATQWGLIWKVIDDEKLMGEATQLAARLATGPTLGLGLTKRLMHGSATRSLDEQLDLERDTQRVAGRSADYAEGVAAFLDRRRANFQGC